MDKNIPWSLIIAKLKGTISEKESKSLDLWLSDSSNQNIFNELSELWTRIQSEASAYNPDKDKYWTELSARMNDSKSQKRSKVIPLRTLWKYAAIACVLLVIGLSYTYTWMQHSNKEEIAFQRYSNLGGKSKVYLPDGTEVWLHANTMLAYRTDFKADKREVKVIGEAFFNVTHDDKKPFIVQTKGMSVTVHGTKFNVESLDSSESATVSLLEGSVSLQTANDNIYLKPGQTATFDKRHRTLTVKEDDVEYVRSWANDQIYFENKSLGYISRYLSKWYDVKIDVDPAITERYSYTFTLRNEPLEEIMRLMSRINPISYQFNESNELTISKK